MEWEGTSSQSLEDQGIVHINTAPYAPWSNGVVETSIQTFIQAMNAQFLEGTPKYRRKRLSRYLALKIQDSSLDDDDTMAYFVYRPEQGKGLTSTIGSCRAIEKGSYQWTLRHEGVGKS
eukprot:Filipodium_phascolosomae@DN962_c0_g1_i1.p1